MLTTSHTSLIAQTICFDPHHHALSRCVLQRNFRGEVSLVSVNLSYIVWVLFLVKNPLARITKTLARLANLRMRALGTHERSFYKKMSPCFWLWAFGLLDRVAKIKKQPRTTSNERTLAFRSQKVATKVKTKVTTKVRQPTNNQNLRTSKFP